MLVRDIADRLIRQHVLDHEFMLRIEGQCIRVRGNSARLHTRLVDYLRTFVVEQGVADVEVTILQAAAPQLDLDFTEQPRPDPGKQIKEKYVDLQDGRIVRKVRTGMVFLCAAGLDLAVGSCEDNDNQVINFINSRFLRWRLGDDGLLLHAAGVAGDGRRGLALTGFSGMGKSTLALHMLSAGFEFVSNDRVVVRRERDALQMFGIPKQPRVNPGTLLGNDRLRAMLPESRIEELNALEPDALWALEEKYDVDVQRCFDSVQRISAEMVGLVVLNWRRGAGAIRVTRVDLSRRDDLLPAIWKLPGVFIETRPRRPGDKPQAEPYRRMLRDRPVYEITGGVDFQRAVESCSMLLQAALPVDEPTSGAASRKESAR